MPETVCRHTTTSGLIDMTAPDPARLGGLEWARRTRGRLSRSERRAPLAAIVRGQGDYAAHPRDGVTRAFMAHIAAEGHANPDGRFAQLRRCGFTVLMRANPLDR